MSISDELREYAHDCCARIDDDIHECCERIREAHQNEFSQMLKIYEVAVEFMKEDADAMDTRSGDTASADSPVHGAAGCVCGGACGCDGEELLAPITTELRDSMRVYRKFSIDDGKEHVELDVETFGQLCDNIDAIHAGLERDYQTACVVNEHQDLEYVTLAKRYDKTISLPFDKDGKVWDVGDELLDDGMVCEVVGIGPNRLYYYCEATDTVEWTQADSRRHYERKLAVEDVLREFAYGLGVPVADSYIAASAAKLRLADGEDA